MRTVKDFKVGDAFPPNGRVHHITELTNGWRKLTVTRADGSPYTTHLHGSTPMSEAFGGGSYKGDAHLS